jgi:hypothetical protein
MLAKFPTTLLATTDPMDLCDSEEEATASEVSAVPTLVPSLAVSVPADSSLISDIEQRLTDVQQLLEQEMAARAAAVVTKNDAARASQSKVGKLATVKDAEAAQAGQETPHTQAAQLPQAAVQAALPVQTAQPVVACAASPAVKKAIAEGAELNELQEYSIGQKVLTLRSNGSWSAGTIQEVCKDKVVVLVKGGKKKIRWSSFLKKVELSPEENAYPEKLKGMVPNTGDATHDKPEVIAKAIDLVDLVSDSEEETTTKEASGVASSAQAGAQPSTCDKVDPPHDLQTPTQRPPQPEAGAARVLVPGHFSAPAPPQPKAGMFQMPGTPSPQAMYPN